MNIEIEKLYTDVKKRIIDLATNYELVGQDFNVDENAMIYDEIEPLFGEDLACLAADIIDNRVYKIIINVIGDNMPAELKSEEAFEEWLVGYKVELAEELKKNPPKDNEFVMVNDDYLTALKWEYENYIKE